MYRGGHRGQGPGTGGLDVIRKEAWPFYRTRPGFRLLLSSTQGQHRSRRGVPDLHESVLRSVSSGTGTKTGYGRPTVGNSVGSYATTRIRTHLSSSRGVPDLHEAVTRTWHGLGFRV